MSDTFRWTEATVLDALRTTYLPAENPLVTEEWAFLTQTALRCPGGRTMNERTIDAFLVRTWSGGAHGHERIAVEVKVTRVNYRNDTDLKRAPAEASAHRCTYAAPVGLIDPDTLPDGWGLIEVARDDHGRLSARWRKRALRRTPTADPDYLIAAGFRRASRAEERIRRGESTAAEVVSLRAEVESLRGVTARALDARDREMVRAKAARAELVALGNVQGCAACGGALTWKRGGPHDSRWVHQVAGADSACYAQRLADFRLGRSGEYPDHTPTPAT